MMEIGPAASRVHRSGVGVDCEPERFHLIHASVVGPQQRHLREQRL